MDVPPMPPALEPKPVAPLLPPVLLRPAALLWLWVLPVAVLLALNVQGYYLIEGNMDEAQRLRAHLFGLAGLADLLLGAGLYFAGRRQVKQQPDSAGTLSVWWSIPAIVVQVGFLWMALAWGERGMIPRSVAEWIYPPQRFLYNQFAFAMVPLFWGLIRLACVRPEKGRGKALVISLVMAVAAPVMLYAVFQLVRHSRRHFEFSPYIVEFSPYVVVTLAIVLGVLMFAAIIRGIALGLRNVDAWSGATERIAIVIFALALPLGGLALNSEIPFPNDFQAWEVYALTVANAAFLLLASWWHARRPLLSFGLLCATLPFSFYFFTVFLPFLPLSIFAVMLMGAGFLVLTPTVLLILHLSLLNKARRGSSGRRLVTGVLCFLVLPGFFTVRGLADKTALNAALDYVYAPAIKDGPMTYESSRTNLRRALGNHRSYKDGIYYPLLSDYYAWLVFDDLVLPDEKLTRLEETFFGKQSVAKKKSGGRGDFWGGGRGSSSNRDRHRMPRANPPPRTVEAAKMDVATKPAESGAALVATLKLTLKNTGGADAEYIKKLPLPAGVYVSGFRLHIEGKPVSGRITEKKTALWVYTMIRDTERRDPGLLFYNAPDELELRVFPVMAKTPSVVEIDFLMPSAGSGPWGAAQDAKWLTEPKEPRLAHGEHGSVVAGGLDALGLPAVKRGTYLHVIVDRSAENGFEGELWPAVDRLSAAFSGASVRGVTLANYETADVERNTGGLEALPLRGGFLADLALAQAIRRHRDTTLDTKREGGPAERPVFVILGRQTPALPEDLRLTEAWADVLPGLEIHGADADEKRVVLHGAEVKDAPLLRLGNSVRPLVLGRAARFAAEAAGAELEYWNPDTGDWKPVPMVRAVPADSPWARAVELQSRQQDYERAPGGEGADLKALVKASRESGVMIASTSYIVVENAAQWRMLDVSERKKLDQNAALDFKEAPAPGAVWLIAGFGMWLGVRRWRAGRKRV